MSGVQKEGLYTVVSHWDAMVSLAMKAQSPYYIETDVCIICAKCMVLLCCRRPAPEPAPQPQPNCPCCHRESNGRLGSGSIKGKNIYYTESDTSMISAQSLVLHYCRRLAPKPAPQPLPNCPVFSGPAMVD